MNAIVLMLVLGQASGLPFPAPRHITATATTRFDAGTVAQVDAANGRLFTNSTIGVITYLVSPNETVWGADGSASGTVASLRPGQSVRVYFHVSDGARVEEIDLESR